MSGETICGSNSDGGGGNAVYIEITMDARNAQTHNKSPDSNQLTQIYDATYDQKAEYSHNMAECHLQNRGRDLPRWPAK